MSKILPKRIVERKKKDDENAKKHAELLQQEMAAKIELSKHLTQRRKIVQRLNVMAEQTRIQRRILSDVCQEMDAAGYDIERLSKILPVLEKVDLVLTQETAKI